MNTGEFRRSRCVSSWSIFSSVAARLVESPSASPSRPSRCAAVIRSARLSRMSINRAFWAGSDRDRAPDVCMLMDAVSSIGASAFPRLLAAAQREGVDLRTNEGERGGQRDSRTAGTSAAPIPRRRGTTCRRRCGRSVRGTAARRRRASDQASRRRRRPARASALSGCSQVGGIPFACTAETDLFSRVETDRFSTGVQP